MDWLTLLVGVDTNRYRGVRIIVMEALSKSLKVVEPTSFFRLTSLARTALYNQEGLIPSRNRDEIDLLWLSIKGFPSKIIQVFVICYV